MPFPLTLGPTGTLQTSIFLSFAFTSAGLFTFVSPSHPDVFGLPAETTTPVWSLQGVRDLTMGVAYGLLAWQRNYAGTKALMTAHVITGVVDAAVVWEYGKKAKMWGHAAGTTVMATVVAGWWLNGGEGVHI
ncbi:uncharacterized protein BDZ99DRAFT_472665 [Mytilinidion resinicola]|uniref:DUF2231 domain-containing protein n=1 Tax=Mytilinidion resinicola TaxID=574789 RepID=A0A6A6Z2J3_9PEZI|nr:uncharacterized protein BDZ99DRAFT_472665 [Mytilinidion resinicola]KAF2815382.1 hypothetical protein BDZ99DRAFT_472665 [Mytilinidion resinicola]